MPENQNCRKLQYLCGSIIEFNRDSDAGSICFRLDSVFMTQHAAACLHGVEGFARIERGAEKAEALKVYNFKRIGLLVLVYP